MYIWEDEDEKIVNNHRTLQAHKHAPWVKTSWSACNAAELVPHAWRSGDTGMTSSAWQSYLLSRDMGCLQQAIMQVRSKSWPIMVFLA